MKKMLFVMAMFIMAISANAQDDKKVSNEDFFIGTWELLVEGLPTGDAEMILIIEKKDGKLGGKITGDNGGMDPLNKCEIDGKTLTVGFTGGGWDVPMYLDREKDGTVSGMMNDMFDVTGKKKVEEKK